MARQYSRAHLIAHARAEAEAKGIDPHLFLMQISRESGFDQDAKGPEVTLIKPGSKTTENPDGIPHLDENGQPKTIQAHGIAQIVSDYHPKRLQDDLKHPLTGEPLWDTSRSLDPFDPLEALEYAALLMQSRIRTHLGKDSWTYDPSRAYTGDEKKAVREALADYNAGPDPDSIYREGGRTKYADLIMADADKIRRIDSVSKAQLDYWHKHGIRPTE